MANNNSSDIRLPSDGRLRDLGVVNWVICRIAAKAVSAPRMHLFTVLGQHKRLFWTWLPFSGMLLGLGRLPRQDTELVILRVGHLRGCEYELQQHRRIAKRFGINACQQSGIFYGPQSIVLTGRQRALLVAVDEFVSTRNLSDWVWKQLSEHLDRRQIIEFCTLIGQYDALAATIAALRIPLDYPE